MRPTLPPPTMKSRSVGRTRSRLTRVWNAPGAVDAGQRVAREDERLLAGAGGHEEDLRVDEDVVALAQHADLAGRRRRPGRCVSVQTRTFSKRARPRPRACCRCRCRACRRGRPRSEPKNLCVCRTSLPPRAVLVVDEEDVRRRPCRARSRRRGPPGPPPRIRHSASTVSTSWKREVAGGLGERGLAVERLDPSRGDRHHAGLHRQAVGDDRALRALAVGAEDPLRRAVLVVVPEDPDAVGEQGRRDRLPLAPGSSRPSR